MSLIDTLLTEPVFQALGWALIHFIWQGALVAAIYGLVAILLRRASGNVRYGIACAAMILMLVLPVSTIFMVSPSMTRAADAPAVESFGEATTARPVPLVTRPADLSISTGRARPSFESAEQRSFNQWARGQFASLLPWLVGMWFAGVLLLSIRFLGGLMMTRRLKRQATSPTVRQWQEKLTVLARRLRVSRPVRLCTSALVEVPTVIGWLRPVILVPVTALTGLSAQQLEALLAHELAHIRRYDYLVNLLQTAIETLLFYHPAVWWISSQVRQEREHCCDDLAVATCGDVLTYARALATLEHLRCSAPQLAVAASGGSLLRRIQRLVGGAPPVAERSDSWLAGVIALATVFAILAGAQTPLAALRQPAVAAEAAAAASSVGSSANGRKDLSTSAASVTADPDGKLGEKAQEPLPEQAATTDPDETVPTAPTVESLATPGQTAQTDSQGGSQDFIGEMAAEGYTNLTVDQLVALRTQGVTAEFAREMKAALGGKPSVDELVAMRIHGVSAAFAGEIKSLGYQNISADKLIALRIHGVSAVFISEWRGLGYTDSSLDTFIAFRIHGVSPAFVREMKEMGFTDISADQLTAFRIHGVSAAFVKDMRSLIGANISSDELTAMRIHGVTPEFVREFEAAGYSKLSAEELVGFRIHGVTPRFVKAMQDLGYNKLSADQLTGLRIHGITPEFIETVKSRGFNDVTIDQLIQLRRLNIVPTSRKK